MSFYKWLEAWAVEQEINAEAKRKKREAKRLANKQVMLRGDRPVTYAAFTNGLLSFCGELSRIVDLSCQTLIQRVHEVTGRQIGDVTKVLHDYIRDSFESQQTWIDNNAKLYENSMTHIFNTFNDAAELRHKEADRHAAKRTNVVVGMLKTIMQQQKELDLKFDNAMLEMREHLRKVDEASERRDQVSFTTQTDLFQNLVTLIARIKDEPEALWPQFTPDWLMANFDDVWKLCRQINNVRENNMPQDMASVAAIKSMRALMPNVRIIDARDAIMNQAKEWGVAA